MNKHLKLFEEKFISINEKFDYNETFFKLMPLTDYLKIKKDNYLSPVGTIEINNTTYYGNWTIPCSNIIEWLKPINYFGSPLQALLMKRAVNETPLVLLHLKINENINKIYNRDISKMFVDPSFSGYFKSFSDIKEYKINETFISGQIDDFKLIHYFKVPKQLSEFVAEPKSLLDYIYGKGDIKYTGEKMTPIGKAFFKVIMKKIFTLNFKNF